MNGIDVTCAADKGRESDDYFQIPVDPERQIAGIQMRVYKKDGGLEGLRFIDEKGYTIIEKTWYTFNEPEKWSEV